MSDKKLHEKFVDISFGFQVVHHFVGLADDVTLFVKGPENIPRLLHFKGKCNHNISYRLVCFPKNHAYIVNSLHYIYVALQQDFLQL